MVLLGQLVQQSVQSSRLSGRRSLCRSGQALSQAGVVLLAGQRLKI
jgi:hypothetical protein